MTKPKLLSKIDTALMNAGNNFRKWRAEAPQRQEAKLEAMKKQIEFEKVKSELSGIRTNRKINQLTLEEKENELRMKNMDDTKKMFDVKNIL
jgi:hypothetical protein